MSIARMLGVRKATIFMLHRFSDGVDDTHATDVHLLRRMLAMLRRQGVEFMRLRDLATHVAARTELTRPTAVFTVDDGYLDFAERAAPIFAGYDCPVTVFLVSDFVSDGRWLWWDIVTESFLASPLPAVSIRVDGRPYSYLLGDPTERRTNAVHLTEVLKWLPDAERLAMLARIPRLLAVNLPEKPTGVYAPLTWDDVRTLERKGVEFGPHSITHPVLSRVDASKARAEIVESWANLRRECIDPAPLFCYPNGSFDSFGQREMDIVREAGMLGAVAFRRRYVDPRVCDVNDRFCLSRFDTPDDLSLAGYVASGLAREEP